MNKKSYCSTPQPGVSVSIGGSGQVSKMLKFLHLSFLFDEADRWSILYEDRFS